jgi:DNA (cytosine-5)-methyltransferase 1
VLIENVQEFQQWVLFPAWELAMQSLGYSLMPYVVDAADHGTPQNRVRLFIVCARSKAPLFISLPKRPHAPAQIDWSAGRWSDINKPGRSPATLARVANAKRQYGPRCLIPFYGSAVSGRSLSRPIGTITTRDRWAVVDGDKMRMLTADECRAAMGFPESYRLPDNHKLAVHLLGNAVVPIVAKDFAEGIKSA